MLVCTVLVAQNRPVADSEVRKVHSSALLIDTHNDITSRTVTGYDIGKNAGDGHTNLAGFKQGGVGAQFFAVYVAANYVNGNHSAHRTLEMIDTVRHDIIDKYPNDFVFALTADDIERAHRQGKIAALMGIEGGHAIEDSLRLLRDYYLLGIRYMTLTHSNTNNWADSSGDMDKADVQHHNGLTDFGKDVVREMNRQGMLVDISHVSDKTFYDALEVSRVPLIASHSSVRAISNHPRNMSDDMIKALAAKGGVIQINYERNYLSEEYRSAFAALAGDVSRMEEKFKKECGDDNVCIGKAEIKLTRDLTEAGKLPHVSWEKIVEHIDHVVKLVGPEHVGLGSDFDGADMPEGLEDCSKLPKLTEALLRKGYKEDDIRKILGGNILRVMEQSEKVSKEMQETQ